MIDTMYIFRLTTMHLYQLYMFEKKDIVEDICRVDALVTIILRKGEGHIYWVNERYAAIAHVSRSRICSTNIFTLVFTHDLLK